MQGISLWKEDLGVGGVIVGAFAVALIVGELDRRSAIVTAEHERMAAQAKADVTPEEQIWLTSPMECDATVNQRTYYVESGKTRCYARKVKP